MIGAHSNIYTDLYARKSDCQDTPAKEQKPKPQGRPYIAFHDEVRRNLEYAIGEREQSDRNSILISVHVGVLKQTVACFLVEDLCITDITTVKVVEQVNPTTERQDP